MMQNEWDRKYDLHSLLEQKMGQGNLIGASGWWSGASENEPDSRA